MKHGYPMTSTYRWFLLYVCGLGVAAALFGAAGLVGLLDDWERARGTSPMAYGLALGFGLWMAAFGWTSLRHAGIRLEEERLLFLRFGPLGSTTEIPLSSIRRYGVGRESGGGRSYSVLLIEVESGKLHRVRVSMYEHWKEFVEILGRALEREPAATRNTFLGARFEER